MFQEDEPRESQDPEKPQNEIEEGVEQEASEPTPEEIVGALREIFSEALENATEEGKQRLLKEMSNRGLIETATDKIVPIDTTKGKVDTSQRIELIFEEIYQRYLDELSSGTDVFDLLSQDWLEMWSSLGFNIDDLFVKLAEKGILE